MITDDDAPSPEITLGGDQFNYHFYGDRVPAPQRPRHWHGEDLAWTFRLFEPPPGYPQAQAMLDRHDVVVLDGEPGTGRRTAATMLLRAHLGTDHRFQELSTDRGPSSFAESTVAPGDLLLLDLTAVDAEGYRQLQRELPAFRARARDAGAKLVVVEPHAARDHLTGPLVQFRVGLGRPNHWFVLRRHLCAHGITWRPGQWPQVPDLDQYLRSATMKDIAALADLTRAARTRDHALHGWLQAALDASGDHTVDVEAAVSEADGRRRALLFAAAMLEGFRLPVVHKAMEILIQVTAHPLDETPALDRDPITTWLRALNAGVDAEGRVWFDKLGYAAAVVAYFWDQRIDLHDALRDWTHDVAVLAELTKAEREDVAERAAEQCLRVDRPNDLTTLTTRWLGTPGRGPSYVVLRAGLLDEQWGSLFRRSVYRWTDAKKIKDEFAAILTRLCVDVLAPTRPEQALVRLHRLARHAEVELNRAATDGLLALVDADDRLWRHMLTRVRRHRADGRWRAEFLLFFAVATPARLTTRDHRHDPGVRRDVVAGWWDAMTTTTVDVPWREHLRAWLDDCVGMADAVDLLSMPVEAAVGAGRAAEVYVLVRDWARAGAERVRLARVLTGLLDKAQGIDVTAYQERTAG